MAFLKDKIGLILFFFTYIVILFQFIIVFTAIDDTDKENSYLIYHKIYFYTMMLMSIWCHIKCALTNPGIIIHKNNQAVIEYYLNVHELGIRRAEKFNQTYGDVFFKNMSEEEELKQLEEDDEEASDYDETQYEPVTSISDESLQRISQEYKIELKRCSQCYVVRPPRCHHCSYCKGCVMKMDHHCPWVNNCIGQFTQKFFILFCCYSMNGCFETLIIEFYYVWYKSNMLNTSWGKIVFEIFQIFFCVLFLIFAICMLNEQWNIIQNDTTMIDIKKKKFQEKRDLNEVINETFGVGFDFSWFFPIKIGGYRPFFFKLLRGKRRN